jgi:hypothetical protein
MILKRKGHESGLKGTVPAFPGQTKRSYNNNVKKVDPYVNVNRNSRMKKTKSVAKTMQKLR